MVGDTLTAKRPFPSKLAIAAAALLLVGEMGSAAGQGQATGSSPQGEPGPVKPLPRDQVAAWEKAGLRAGDIITQVDGRAVRGSRDVSQHLRDSWDKKTVPVQIVREKKEMTLQLELPARQRGDRRPSTRPAMVPGVRL